jgi:hypothetical protein
MTSQADSPIRSTSISPDSASPDSASPDSANRWRAALKEWAIAVTALTAGETILLLRKGGIREPNGRFVIPHRQILLYPTYEHQKPEWVKPSYRASVHPVAAGWHPTEVTIAAGAELTHLIEVNNPDEVAALLPWHIWTADFATTRLRWKPRSPLTLLLLRVFRLREAVTLPYHESYGGCRSWLTLQEAIAIDNAKPVLEDTVYQQQVEHILQCVSQATPNLR